MKKLLIMLILFVITQKAFSHEELLLCVDNYMVRFTNVDELTEQYEKYNESVCIYFDKANKHLKIYDDRHQVYYSAKDMVKRSSRTEKKGTGTATYEYWTGKWNGTSTADIQIKYYNDEVTDIVVNVIMFQFIFIAPKQY